MTFRFRSRAGARVAAVAAVALALSLVGCAPPSSGGGSGQTSIRVGMVGSTSDEVDPYQQQGSVSSDALFKQVYEGLTARDSSGKVVYVLAESMEPNAAKDLWTIKLRPGVKLHNGETFNAEDAAGSITAMIDPKKAWAYATNLDFIDAAGIEVVDGTTLKLHLKKPFGLVPEMFSMARINMRSIRGGATVDKPAGTGPWTIDSFTPGQEAKLSKFADYWGKKPKLDKLTLSFFTEQNAVTNAIRGGQIDVAQGIPFPEVPALKGDPNLGLVVSDTASYPLIAMSMQDKPFTDAKVREAIRLSVDRERIVKNAFGGYATVANDFIGKNSSCEPPKLPQRKQDLAKAKQLVSEAGAEGAQVELVTDGAFPGMMEMAQLVADDAAKAGIKISVRKLDVATFLDRWLDWPMFISYTSSPYEITAKGHFLPGGSENGTHMDDPEYNTLASELYQTTDPAAQCTIIQQLQTIEHERGGYLVPVYGQNITVHRANVKGLEKDLYGRTSFLLTDVTVG